MLDIEWIIHNQNKFDEIMKRRGATIRATEVLAADFARRQEIAAIQALSEKKNKIAKTIGERKRAKESVDDLTTQGSVVSKELASLEANKNAEIEFHRIMSYIPNLLADDVPAGLDESFNVELRRHGQSPQFTFHQKDHVELGEQLGELDFKQAALMSGCRFSILSGGLARMERALGNFMLDLLTRDHGYTEVSPPLLVRDNAVFGTGQLPKFAEDLFYTTSGHWLIPTAEVPITNIFANKVIDEISQPIRFTALTPCFRSEAGSAGKDTRGLIRQHQFKKVEMVAFTRPQDSEAEHERMVAIAESMLVQLGLAYRVIILCGGDTGFTSNKTYDIEVWLPSEQKYREISSCSNFLDWQARRMKTRYKSHETGRNIYPHTLNGSALALGRTLLAIMENYQNENGSISTPDCLKKYLST